MPILGRNHTLLTICSVFGFHKTFLLSVLVGFVLMSFITFLDHLSQDYDLRYVFFEYEGFKFVSEILVLFMLFALGFNLGFSRGLIQFLCDSIGKSRKSKHGFYSGNGKVDLGISKDVQSIDSAREITEKSATSQSLHRKLNSDFDEKCGAEDELETEEDRECDVLVLRKMVKIERRRANAAIAEVEKERAASASAAEEAMAMILRLQREKSSIEMEWNQYRRLAEEKQSHDSQVIESLEWLVWRNEAEMSLLQEDLNGLLKSHRLLGGIEEGSGFLGENLGY